MWEITYVYVAWQSILSSCANVETKDDSNQGQSIYKNSLFKHMKGSFLFSQIKTLKSAEFKRTKKCFILIEIANSVIEI